MKKNRHKNEKPQYNDRQLLKAMNELEATLQKGGDELLEQDPEGGLSTEGEPLSKKAPKGKGSDAEVTKSDDDSDDGGSDDGSEEDTAMKGGDDDSEEDDDGSDEGGSDDGSDDESDDESPPMPTKKSSKGGKVTKSLRERADDDETLQKAIEISDFLEAIVDQSSETINDMTKALIDDNQVIKRRLHKSEQYQRDFNGRLAAGLIAMGRAQQETLSLVKSLLGQPNVRMRKSVLSSDEVIEPHRRGDDDEAAIHPAKIADWLFKKAVAGDIDQLNVIQFETHGQLGALPPDIRKALINDLQK
jgi:hypothetical protein